MDGITPKARTRGRLSSWLARALLGTGLFVGASFSCTRAQLAVSTPNKEPPHTPAAPPVPRVHPTARPFAPAPTNYAEAVRQRDFERAASLMDHATRAEQNSPEVRYARALVALELDDIETALRKVDGLDVDHPSFASETRSVRERAAQRSRDVALVGTFFAGSSPHHKLVMAEAHEQDTSWAEAQRLADEVIYGLARSDGKDAHDLATRAHALKARIFEVEGKKREAAAELKWIAVHAPLVRPADIGFDEPLDTRMTALDAQAILSAEERLTRAKTFSELGLVEATERELLALMAMGKAPQERDALIASALYTSRTDYERAASLYRSAAQAAPARRAEYLYLEAKSLARSQRDAEAIDKYDIVAKLGGIFSEHASYQAARLRMMDGQFDAAVQGFERYLKVYGRRAQHRADVKYSLAVSRLANADYQNAARDLNELVAAAADDRQKAELMELRAVALLGQGARAQASAVFHQVIELRPLSLAALLAAARLRQMGEPLPPWIFPPTQAEHQPTLGPLQLALPEKTWRLSRVGLDVEAELALRADEASIRSQFAKRAGEALCETYGLIQSAQRRFQIAQTAASWSSLRQAPSPQTAWQWNCIYPEPYGDLVLTQAKQHKVPAALIYAIMRQESAFRPEVVSPADAVGLMQIIPPTAERIATELGENYQASLMRSPATNIKYGTYYLRRLLDTFGERYELAAAAYNAGPQALTRWLRAGERLPLDLFVAHIPYVETRNYVYQVMGNYARYALLGHAEDVPLLDLDLPAGLSAASDAY